MSKKVFYTILILLAVGSGYIYFDQETQKQDCILNGQPYLNWTLQDPPMQNIQASDVYIRGNPIYFLFSDACLLTLLIHLVSGKVDEG